MINLLILIGAVLMAFRILGPLLRIIISLLAKLISFAFLIALSIIVLVALLSHGTFISSPAGRARGPGRPVRWTWPR